LKEASKNFIWTALKLSLAFSMVFWMVKSGKLDLASLSIYVKYPLALVGCFVYWVGFGVLGGAFRWFLLLRGIGLEVKLFKAGVLTLIGLFFNSAMPGAVGGDVIKALYVTKAAQSGKKSAAIVSIFLDRVIGLYGLFTFATIISLLAWNGISENPVLRHMSLIVLSIFGGITLVFAHLLFHNPKYDILERLLRLPILNKFRSLYQSLLLYREAKSNFFLAWLISIFAHAGAILLFWQIAELLSDQHVGFVKFCTAAPLAILATAIPVAPGGMGVGHLAFEHTLSLINVSGGANIFNVVFLSQMAFNLSGIFPYLMYKKMKSDDSP
jgi:uncharacterized protein (TIRG00374 family)